MPRYFFDVDDGERRTRDGTGMYLINSDDVRREAGMLLQNLGVPAILDGRDRRFTVTVRDEAGSTIYRGSAILSIEIV